MAIILTDADNAPSQPSDFERRLQTFDKDLLILWHKPPHWKKSRPGVWKIEQCIEHLSGKFRASGMPEHTHVCRRIYVTVVQDEDGTPMPLGDHVLDKLKAMRANSESFGGETARGLTNFIRHSESIDQELESKRAAAREDTMRHNRKFNRRQINQAFDLIQRHDMRPNR